MDGRQRRGQGLEHLTATIAAAEGRGMTAKLLGARTDPRGVARARQPAQRAAPLHRLPAGQIQRRLKQSFDPAGIFNPGRLYPEF